MRKYIIVITLFIISLICIDNAYAATLSNSQSWGYDKKHPSLANVFDCSDDNCNVSLNANSDIIPGTSSYFYYQGNYTSMSANGAGIMWTYLLDTPLKSGYLYSITSYVCHTSSANFVYKNIYSSGALDDVVNKDGTGTVYYSNVLSNLSTMPFDSPIGDKCGYITTIYKPNYNSKYIGINFSVSSAVSNYTSSFVGYDIQSLGIATGLTSSDIQNVIDDSGLANADDIEDLQDSVGNIQSSLSNIEDNINNNINSAEDNITSSIEDSESNIKDSIQESTDSINQGIKDGFENCRDSYNLLNLSNGSYTNNGITSVINNGIIKSTGVTTATYFNLIPNSTYTLPKGTYTFSIDESISTNTITLALYGTSWSNFFISKNSKSTTLTLTEDKTIMSLTCSGVASGTTINFTIKPMLNEGTSAKSYEPYGEQICSNRIDETNDKLDNLNGSINNSDSSGATGDASSFFEGFTTDTFGLTSIITAPLNLIKSISSKTCTPLNLQVPFVDKTMQLPCMTTIYTNYFGSFLTIYQTITFGIISYWVCIRVFALVKDFKNPDHDEIEVMDL